MPVDPVVPDPKREVPLLMASDLDRLVRVHGRRLRNFIRRRVGNAADVEDLVQDTCLEALRCLERYQGAARPETWLFGIALNLVRNHFRRASQQPPLESEPAEGETEDTLAEDPINTLERLQEIDRLCRRMDKLPQASVSVLRLVFDERLTYEQAASRLQVPVGTIRSRIARARAVLKGDEGRCA
jgi:RNA polymerase sigma factor (sigma-70 family)